jgi:hypothetical protein
MRCNTTACSGCVRVAAYLTARSAQLMQKLDRMMDEFAAGKAA